MKMMTFISTDHYAKNDLMGIHQMPVDKSLMIWMLR